MNPSFDSRVYEDGSFHSFGGGGPCETSDLKLSQNAVFRGEKLQVWRTP